MNKGSEAAAVAETHCAVVFFVGDRAYKLKKPVDLGFLDFRALPARRQACERELRLNRRLAPDVYLGLAWLLVQPSPSAGPAPTLTDADRAGAEPLVVMRRMPEGARLSTLVRAGVDVRGPLRRLARQLAAFHAVARAGPEVAAEGTRDALRGRWRDNIEATRPYRGTVLDEAEAEDVERLAFRYLAGREPLFAARIAAGLIRDGHGDLIADDIFCLPDGPRALDCLEFDDRLRYVDGLDDAAFLAMDLERLGAAELARSFLDWYVEFAGTPRVTSLEHHYVAYRAFVRAKIGCLRAAQGDASGASDARLHTTVAARHLRSGAVRLVLVGGLPGTGKTTVAGGLADRLGAVLLGSDRVRKELAGLGPTQPAAAPYRSGLYAPAWTAATYAALLERAGVLLGRGESVVLDASWADPDRRAEAAALAAAATADLVELRCVAPAAVAAARLRERAGTGQPSDADCAVAAAMAADFAAWPGAAVLDTGTPDVSAALDAAAATATTVDPAGRAVGLWPASQAAPQPGLVASEASETT
jgi:uncharacterized protein